jgi:hypothetical protein
MVRWDVLKQLPLSGFIEAGGVRDYLGQLTAGGVIVRSEVGAIQIIARLMWSATVVPAHHLSHG